MSYNLIQTIKTMLPMLAFLYPLAAQAAVPAIPDAGSILQEVQPAKPTAPSSNGTGLTIEPQKGGKLPTGVSFKVDTIQLSGNTRFDTKTLHALVVDAEGQTLTLVHLDELASRITNYYRSHGFPLARAIIPAQTIQSGTVRIEILEASFGKIHLHNQSRVSDSLLEDTLSSLQSGQIIEQAEMDHALLLLSDIPGIVINSTLKPGDAVGTSDLLVAGRPSSALMANVVLDGYGNRYTGKVRAGATLNLSNPLHYGNLLSINGLSSGSGMNYGRISYESLLSGRGTRLGGAYSNLRYILGGSLVSLLGHGSAEAASLWAKHPLIRSRNINIYAQLQYDQNQLRDHIDIGGLKTDRHLESFAMSISGDARDVLPWGGINTWNLSLVSGRVGFDNRAAQLGDTASAGTQGGFTKWNLNVSHLQSLSQKNMLYFTMSAQGTSTNLDSSEKMALGGPNTVSAYDTGAISGDTGYQGTAEFKHNLDPHWQAVFFVDSAHLTVNKKIWAAGANSATLSGVGLGLNWTGSNQWSAKASIASPLGSTPQLVANVATTRAWMEISKRF